MPAAETDPGRQPSSFAKESPVEAGGELERYGEVCRTARQTLIRGARSQTRR
jgi:hypothetical protein